MSLNLENPTASRKSAGDPLKTVWVFFVISLWINENIIAEVALYPSYKDNSCDDYT